MYCEQLNGQIDPPSWRSESVEERFGGRECLTEFLDSLPLLLVRQDPRKENYPKASVTLEPKGKLPRDGHHSD